MAFKVGDNVFLLERVGGKILLSEDTIKTIVLRTVGLTKRPELFNRLGRIKGGNAADDNADSDSGSTDGVDDNVIEIVPASSLLSDFRAKSAFAKHGTVGAVQINHQFRVGLRRARRAARGG